MEIPKFEREYRVHVYETSVDERANTCSIFNYMQDIAAEHAIKLGYGRDDLMKDNHIWVLSRMTAEIKMLPFRNETIIVRTWPFGTDSIFALRLFELLFPDGRIIARASSSWLIIDATTKKIRRPDKTFLTYNSAREASNIPLMIASKIDEASPEGELSEEFKVKQSDLDVNLHTNNVNYLKWVIDSYDPDFMMKYVPSSVEINYLAESMLGDNITIRRSREDGTDQVFRHSIIRTTDNKELCRIRLEWKGKIY